MSGARFVCSDPDAGDFEFADVEAVLDALEAGLVTSLARSLPDDEDERERRREAYARLRSPAAALEEPTTARRDGGQRLAVVGVALALALLGIIGWLAVTFATGLNVLAAHAVSGGQAR
jgi:hypothetical protein